jgi:two-component system chemotaxis sensor kinase CheA
VWNLVFEPGLSTADVVTDVSGRGVGLDVVRQSIGALGGSVEIDGAEGRGMCVRVRLPLSMATLDGVGLSVGDERYVLPLSSVVESIELRPGLLRTAGGRRVIEVRRECLPVHVLGELLGVARRTHADKAPACVVVIGPDGGRAALLVDELLGRCQGVMRSLASSQRRIEGVAGAAILDDGRVALILDVASLVPPLIPAPCAESPPPAGAAPRAGPTSRPRARAGRRRSCRRRVRRAVRSS